MGGTGRCCSASSGCTSPPPARAPGASTWCSAAPAVRAPPAPPAPETGQRGKRGVKHLVRCPDKRGVKHLVHLDEVSNTSFESVNPDTWDAEGSPVSVRCARRGS